MLGLNSHCGLVWATTLDGWTNSSPALADALGNGELQVAEGTWNGASGSVWLLNGATGRPIWHVPALGAIIGGIVTANLGRGLPGSHRRDHRWPRNPRRAHRLGARHRRPRHLRPAELAPGHRRLERYRRDHCRRIQRRQPGGRLPLRGGRLTWQPGQRDRSLADVPPRRQAHR